ncbi:O-antigen/teichoic acid export membrane protein [Mariniflexile fucanivorans]|uniref:O-antigen/teichoic acid export membrane protein n=1 Tax=Mariniflexile fucanivorans TaxID=264023 RepID=A0A4R1RS00_9FLAO|nr:oligosaccharide flippase family protein [Mariniflexile fucanivorans]TCL69238.1 O-antigen/teichoic acid export membrane protein [Mariniflexile fucanivorans]
MKSSNETKSYKINTFLNLFLKIGSLGFNLLTIPLLINYLGEERFGIWQTFISLTMIITVFKLGYDNGLRNRITALIAKDQKDEISGIVYGAFSHISKTTFFIAFPLIIIVYNIDPTRFIEDVTIPKEEIIYSLLIFLFFSFLNNILSLTDSISLGFQKSFFTSSVQFVFVFVFYIVIFCFFKIELGSSLIYTVLTYCVVRLIVYILYFFFVKKKFRLKVLKYTNIDSFKKMSYNFFIIQGLGLTYMYIDNFAITYSLGPVKTAEYSIIYKLFFSIINIFSILLIQFWDSSRLAYLKNEFVWIKKMIIRFSLLSVLILLGCLTVSVFAKELMFMFLGNSELEFERTTFYLFSIYTFVHCLFAIFINLFNGINLFSYQKIALVVMLMIYLSALIFGNLSTYGYNLILIIKIICTIVVLPILIVPYLRKFYFSTSLDVN